MTRFFWALETRVQTVAMNRQKDCSCVVLIWLRFAECVGSCSLSLFFCFMPVFFTRNLYFFLFARGLSILLFSGLLSVEETAASSAYSYAETWQSNALQELLRNLPEDSRCFFFRRGRFWMVWFVILEQGGGIFYVDFRLIVCRVTCMYSIDVFTPCRPVIVALHFHRINSFTHFASSWCSLNTWLGMWAGLVTTAYLGPAHGAWRLWLLQTWTSVWKTQGWKQSLLFEWGVGWAQKSRLESTTFVAMDQWVIGAGSDFLAT